MLVTILLMFIFYKRDEIVDFCLKRGILKMSIVHSFIHKTISYFV